MHQRLAELPVMQRAAGTGRITVAARDGATHLEEFYQQGCAKIRLPSARGAPGREAVLINTAGGLTGGDRLRWSAGLGPGTALSLTTPACEKIYRAASGEARVAVELAAGPGARLAWLPQETILFEQAALDRTLTVSLDPSATALIVEPVIFGREAMGETIETVSFRDRWRVSRGGALLHAEEFRLGSRAGLSAGAQLARNAVLGGARALATVLWVAPNAEDRLDAVRGLLGSSGGAGAWDGRLLARMVAGNGFDLRRALLPVLHLLGAGAPLPKLWSI